MADTQQRFMEKVGSTDHCWEWNAAKNAAGYGLIRWRSTSSLAHRVSYELFKGKIPEGKVEILHTCDNPGCVNPEHLELGTHVDNMADRSEKGRAKLSQRKRKDLKLTPESVAKIKLLLNQKIPQRHIAAQFAVSQATIMCINRGYLWADVKADSSKDTL